MSRYLSTLYSLSTYDNYPNFPVIDWQRYQLFRLLEGTRGLKIRLTITHPDWLTQICTSSHKQTNMTMLPFCPLIGQPKQTPFLINQSPPVIRRRLGVWTVWLFAFLNKGGGHPVHLFHKLAHFSFLYQMTYDTMVDSTGSPSLGINASPLLIGLDDKHDDMMTWWHDDDDMSCETGMNHTLSHLILKIIPSSTNWSIMRSCGRRFWAISFLFSTLQGVIPGQPHPNVGRISS